MVQDSNNLSFDFSSNKPIMPKLAANNNGRVYLPVRFRLIKLDSYSVYDGACFTYKLRSLEVELIRWNTGMLKVSVKDTKSNKVLDSVLLSAEYIDKDEANWLWNCKQIPSVINYLICYYLSTELLEELINGYY